MEGEGRIWREDMVCESHCFGCRCAVSTLPMPNAAGLQHYERLSVRTTPSNRSLLAWVASECETELEFQQNKTPSLDADLAGSSTLVRLGHLYPSAAQVLHKNYL